MVALPLRLAASLGLAVYLGGALVAPLVHVLRDHAGFAVADAQQVDPEEFRDANTGRVDLSRLAEAMGLAGSHDESKPHSHGPGDQSGHHGANALEHFGIAVLAAAAISVVVVTPVPERAPPAIAKAPVLILKMQHLTAQRSTAPPQMA